MGRCRNTPTAHSPRGAEQPLTHTAVLQVWSLCRARQFLQLLGTPARGEPRSSNNNNIQHTGPGSDANCDPPHHSSRTWTGARTQSLAAAWESRLRRGARWACGWLELMVRFHLLLNDAAPTTTLWVKERTGEMLLWIWVDCS